MIQPKAFASVEDRATLTRISRDARFCVSTTLPAVTVRQTKRTPLVFAKKESITQINTLPGITPAKTATLAPVIIWPEINQFGQTRQCTIIATSRTLKTTATAVIRQVFAPFSYIRVIPPPGTANNIDGGQFDDSHSRSLDGGQFGEEPQTITDAGSF